MRGAGVTGKKLTLLERGEPRGDQRDQSFMLPHKKRQVFSKGSRNRQNNAPPPPHCKMSVF